MTIPVLVYLDQRYWGDLLEPEHEGLRSWLTQLVGRHQIEIPLSAQIWMETSKAHNSKRDELLGLFSQLTVDTALKNYASVLRLQYRAYLEGHVIQWLRRQITTASPKEMFCPVDTNQLSFGSSIVDFFSSTLAHLTPEQARKQFSSVLYKSAEQANRKPWSEHSRELLGEGVLSQILGISSEEIVLDEKDLLGAFPSFRIMKEIREQILEKRAGGFEPNDIVDLSFVSQTLAYLDVVTVDRRFGSRIRESGLEKHIYGEVVSRIEELKPAVERAIERKSS